MPVKNKVPELVAAKYGDERVNLKEVEAKTGLDYRTVSAWMKDRVTRADFPVLEKWCKYLGVTVGDILVYEE
jgi:DNA-binding Xre family transcriptional regulator